MPRANDARVKGKVVLMLNKVPRHEDVWNGGISPRIPNFGTSLRSVFNFTPRPLYPWGNIPPGTH
jgi:hypothetical protein